MGFTESEFIEWCVGAPGAQPVSPLLLVGPGDDAAVLDDGGVISVDTVVQGTHFDADTPLERVAHKALAVSVSDVCAMGAEPALVFVSAQLPRGTDGRVLAAALRAAAADLDVILAGGDTVAAPAGALALAVTAWGRLPPGTRPWTRSGARPGDRLWVSGPLGGSRAGRHLLVVPRRDVVAVLRAAHLGVHAALDLSDGLGRDLPRICTASGVGAEVAAERVPVHPDVRPECEPLAAALGDGEDFELLLALPPEATPPAGAGLVEIGRITEHGGPVLLRDGRAAGWPYAGYEHGF